jgi:malate dehydrogenase
MDVSVVGAGGVVGRQIAIALAGARILPPTSRLQLVGRSGGPSAALLPGLAADLADAHAEELPHLDLAFKPEDILGDVIVIAAGETVAPGSRARERADLAAANEPVIDAIARAIARNGHGEELVLVLTNPVEAAVGWCCRHLDPRRVVGLGAYLDTMRFRQEIALDLGVRRQRVQGLVLGEHGPRMVPCWSTVSVHGFAGEHGRQRLATLAASGDPTVAEAAALVRSTLDRDGPAAAFRLIDGWGPALRTVIRPMATQLSGARTPVGTAESVVRLLRTLLDGGRVMAAAQVQVAGEFLALRGVVGAPVVLSLAGLDRIMDWEVSAAERAAVTAGLWSGR